MLVPFHGHVPNGSLVGLIVRVAGASAIPVNVAAVVPPGVPVTSSVAWTDPTVPAVGAKWTAMVHVPVVAASVAMLHESLSIANWFALVPPSVTASAPVATPPLLVNVNVVSGELWVCGQDPKALLVGLSPMAAGARPVPVIAAVPLAAFAPLTVTVAASAAADAGVKATANVHMAPPASADVHWLALTTKSAAFVPLTATTGTPEATPPPFCTVNVCVAVGVPWRMDPKSYVPGVTAKTAPAAAVPERLAVVVPSPCAAPARDAVFEPFAAGAKITVT